MFGPFRISFEVVIDFSRRGIVELSRRLIDRKTPPDRPFDHDDRW
jgi:hypothetical protein